MRCRTSILLSFSQQSPITNYQSRICDRIHHVSLPGEQMVVPARGVRSSRIDTPWSDAEDPDQYPDGSIEHAAHIALSTEYSVCSAWPTAVPPMVGPTMRVLTLFPLVCYSSCLFPLTTLGAPITHRLDFYGLACCSRDFYTLRQLCSIGQHTTATTINVPYGSRRRQCKAELT